MDMQMAGAAIVTGLAGGNALAGAAGAAIASFAAGKLNDVSRPISPKSCSIMDRRDWRWRDSENQRWCCTK
jgi:hypothetical protein